MRRRAEWELSAGGNDQTPTPAKGTEGRPLCQNVCTHKIRRSATTENTDYCQQITVAGSSGCLYSQEIDLHYNYHYVEKEKDRKRVVTLGIYN